MMNKLSEMNRGRSPPRLDQLIQLDKFNKLRDANHLLSERRLLSSSLNMYIPFAVARTVISERSTEELVPSI